MRALKYAYGENQDYSKEITRLKSQKLNPVQWMDILPVSFSTEHNEMLAHAKVVLDREVLAVAPVFSKLIVALGTAAYAKNGDLNKQVTRHDDLMDFA
jgi:hypothetical protein